MSWAIAGQTIILDPGHGGEDPGKVGIGGSFEKDINLQVAIKVRSLLAQGRTGQPVPLFSGNKLIEWPDRSSLVEERGARIVIANDSVFPMNIMAICPYMEAL